MVRQREIKKNYSRTHAVRRFSDTASLRVTGYIAVLYVVMTPNSRLMDLHVHEVLCKNIYRTCLCSDIEMCFDRPFMTLVSDVGHMTQRQERNRSSMHEKAEGTWARITASVQQLQQTTTF